MSPKHNEEKISPLAPESFPPMPDIAGVALAAGACGLKKSSDSDLMVVELAPDTTAAGVFTRSLTASAPVQWSRKALRGGGQARGLIVNSGGANVFTGAKGMQAVERTVEAVADQFFCCPSKIFAASTGVIGKPLAFDKIIGALPRLKADLAPGAWQAAAKAMMTTDTFPKGATRTADIGGLDVTLNGIAKGSGMIAPDMATMLAFIVTDADIHPNVLRAMLGLHVRTTFNSVTVDGDTSTNDTCLLFATGASGAPRIGRVGDRRLKEFSRALDGVMLDLAHQLVRDGEGATKFVKVTVDGAASPASARKLAKSIADSPLVKTAIAGEDANWGRIVMAVGKTEEPVDRDRLAVRFGPHVAAIDGAPSPTYDEAKMSAYMKNAEIDITVEVGAGRASATVWTCDLTKRYIEINGDYRS